METGCSERKRKLEGYEPSLSGTSEFKSFPVMAGSKGPLLKWSGAEHHCSQENKDGGCTGASEHIQVHRLEGDGQRGLEVGR